MQENGETMEMSGDDIFKLPDGKLTTMYHYLKGMKSDDNDDKMTQETMAATTEELKV